MNFKYIYTVIFISIIFIGNIGIHIEKFNCSTSIKNSCTSDNEDSCCSEKDEDDLGCCKKEIKIYQAKFETNELQKSFSFGLYVYDFEEPLILNSKQNNSFENQLIKGIKNKPPPFKSGRKILLEKRVLVI